MQTWTNSQPTPRALALAGAIAGDAVADALEAAELLDVDVDQLAGMLALVAAHRLGRLRHPTGACAASCKHVDARDKPGHDPKWLRFYPVSIGSDSSFAHSPIEAS